MATRLDPKPVSVAPPGRILDLRLTVAGHQPRKANWVNHRFTPHALGLVVRGRGSYRVDDGPAQPIGPGTAFWVYPGAVFHYGPDEGTTWDEYHVGAIGPGIERWQRHGWVPTDGRPRKIAPAQIAPTVKLFKQMLSLCRSESRGDPDRAVLLAERILLEIAYASSPAEVAVEEDRIAAALRHVRQHLAETIDLERVADDFHMSYSLFRQRVKQRTGLSPAKYLTHLRCNAACRLLAATDRPVKAVAAEVGYTDSATFSKAFKRTVSVWPVEYRRGQRGMG